MQLNLYTKGLLQSFMLLTAVVFCLSAAPPAIEKQRNAQHKAPPFAAKKLFVIGASTTANYPSSAAPNMGWGQAFQSFLDPAAFVVSNHAQSGESSKSFYNKSGLWPVVRNQITSGDFLFIKFGHNDRKPDAALYTNPGTSPSDPAGLSTTQYSYKWYLTQYINHARSVGAYPVLVTPVQRFTYKSDGTIDESLHGRYPAAVRELAVEKGLPLVDLNSSSKATFEDMGKWFSLGVYARFYAPYQYTGHVQGVLDDLTHFQENGAKRMAEFVAQAVTESNDPSLRLLAVSIINAGQVQAEGPQATRLNCAIEPPSSANNTGWTGTGYVNSRAAANQASYIEFTVHSAKDAAAVLRFRYANGSTTVRTAFLTVNGGQPADVVFNRTTNFSTWVLTPGFTKNLVAGNNLIRLTTTAEDAGNIDYLDYRIVRDNVLEAESNAVVRDNCAVETAQPGWQRPESSGYVNFLDATGNSSSVQFNINRATGGTVNLFFGYALGGVVPTPDNPGTTGVNEYNAGVKRTVQLVVNGSAQNLTFNATGGFEKWRVKNVAVSLNAGSNTVKLVTINQDGPNLDYLAFAGTDGGDVVARHKDGAAADEVFPSTPSKLTVAVSPNPAASFARLVITHPENATLLIQVVNASGQVVGSYRPPVKGTVTHYALPVAALRAGIYSVIVNDGVSQTQTKLVVQ